MLRIGKIVPGNWALVLCLLPVTGCRGTIYLDDGGTDLDNGVEVTDADGLSDDGIDAGDPGGSDPGSGDDGGGADPGPGDDDGGADSGPGDDGGADPGPCPATLAARLTSVTISVAPDSVNTAGGGYFSRYTPPILAPRSGGSWLAWLDASGKAHITPLDASDRRAGTDLTVEANELRGLAAHAGGFAVMVQRGTDQMALVGFDLGGNKTFDTIIIGNNSHDQQGDKWVKREWGDNGRLAFFQDRYAVYFGHTQNWGSQGEHQGDLLWFYDLAGNRSGGYWDWGCSHSLDVRLGWNGTLLGPVCLSDCYPTKAIWFNHRGAEIHPEPSGNCSGSSSGELGGLLAAADGFWLTFVSPEGRASRDVALVSISNSSQVGQVHWLTDTASVQEASAKLAAYGDDFLAAWQAGSDTMAAVADRTGSFLLGPEAISTSFNQQTDFVNFPNGDVGWADGAGSELHVFRLRYCR